MRVVTIMPALNGWVVHVGCSQVVFNDKDAMLQELDRYIDFPQQVEKEYQENAVNKNDCPVTAEVRPGTLLVGQDCEPSERG